MNTDNVKRTITDADIRRIGMESWCRAHKDATPEEIARTDWKFRKSLYKMKRAMRITL